MKVEAVDPTTGEKISADLTPEQVAGLENLDQERMSDSKLNTYINDMNLSAGEKAFILDMKTATLRSGEKTIQVGRRVIEIAVALQAQFPLTTFGLIVGLVTSILIASIPILGSILGGVVTPIAITIGLAWGFSEDFKDKALYQKFTDATAKFDRLKPTIDGGRQALKQLLNTFAVQT
jgi:hypothetical protein